MKKVLVYYKNIFWGTLLDPEIQPLNIYFEYSEEAISSGIELSPIKCKLQKGTQNGFPYYLSNLPGFIYDSLPDGWGMTLLNAMFVNKGINSVSPLDYLIYSSKNTIGALTFEPAKREEEINKDIDLLSIVEQNKTVYDETADTEALLSLINYGGSAHGARPKILLEYNEITGKVSTIGSSSTKPWIFKFQAKGDTFSSIGLEQIYMECAKDAGLDVSPSKYIKLSEEQACFATQRFDVVNGKSIHTHTLAGIIHADFTNAGSLDCDTYLKIVNYVTKNPEEVKKAFRQCVFNIIFNNKDDHSKNFSFLMPQDNVWKLAPSYDLTFNLGNNGENNMGLNCNGIIKGKNIKLKELMDFAKRHNLKIKDSADIIEQVCLTATNFSKKYTNNNYNVNASVISNVQKFLTNNISTLCVEPVKTNKNKVIKKEA